MSFIADTQISNARKITLRYRIMGAASTSPKVDLVEALKLLPAVAILHHLRNCSDDELRRDLERANPDLLRRLTGPQGYQVKRFLIMRDDVLPPSWDDYFCRHASDLFAHGLETDAILQRLLRSRKTRSD